jgi:hypothetical protein
LGTGEVIVLVSFYMLVAEHPPQFVVLQAENPQEVRVRCARRNAAPPSARSVDCPFIVATNNPIISGTEVKISPNRPAEEMNGKKSKNFPAIRVGFGMLFHKRSFY